MITQHTLDLTVSRQGVDVKDHKDDKYPSRVLQYLQPAAILKYLFPQTGVTVTLIYLTLDNPEWTLGPCFCIKGFCKDRACVFSNCFISKSPPAARFAPNVPQLIASGHVSVGLKWTIFTVSDFSNQAVCLCMTQMQQQLPVTVWELIQTLFTASNIQEQNSFSISSNLNRCKFQMCLRQHGRKPQYIAAFLLHSCFPSICWWC